MTVPLATAQAFLSTAYGDIASALQANELERTMLRATRRCEAYTGHLLSPFTASNDLRLQDSDTDSMILSQGLVSPSVQIATEYMAARSMRGSVRHFWVCEFPQLFTDLWYGEIVSMEVSWPDIVEPIIVPVDSIQFQNSTGHGRFSIGTLVPQGSNAHVTYTGGYQTVPEDLEEAVIVMAASMLLRSLDPVNVSTAHDPMTLQDYAQSILRPYCAPGSGSRV